ncbi:KH domain-containing, RNA-binding, signal transduction-associated protein 2 isoform X4 [Perognathus longimembris pacificus]|uniref:KH domain-containing, RNA-binding, signal transduction-associated protein 2 isoform X4 n=1 Tax=Perognathus longimembris pacificus TaxID=214514 RepID=UPI002019770F|nr:KH domain-containing, RNA-binding, signal transduction-associated protein 2 isoform X4 [Perognathus longimembris pacificus]
MEEEKYLPELMAEKDSLDPSFVHASRLLAEEIEKFQGSDGKKEEEEKKYLDVISNKNIKLSERVLIPVKQYPKFNFVGKLLGPRGNSLKRLQEETGAKMSILGKGSMRDKAKDYNDEIRQEQLRELSYLNGSEDSGHGRGIRGRGIRIASTTPSRGRGGAVPPPPPPGRGVLTPRGTTVTRGALPVPPVARGVSAPRARGTSSAPGYRALPHPVPEAYEEYAYDDGYVGDYEDQAYEAYDSSYATQTQSVAEYYDYGHGVSEDIYDSYAPEEWATSRSSLKAPPPRSARGGYREHPYGRY